jgi:hypothetical protein
VCSSDLVDRDPGRDGDRAADRLAARRDGGRDHESEELLVLDLDAESEARARALGFEVASVRHFEQLGISLWRLEIPDALSPEEALDRLRGNLPGVAAERDVQYELASGDCDGIRCYGQDLVHWPSRGCAERAHLGILDSAVDLTHPALQGSDIQLQRVADQAATAADRDHGTAIASLLVGQPGSGVSGLLPQARLYAADVFRRQPGGTLSTDAGLVAAGLDWMLQQPQIDALNISIAGPDSLILRRSIERVLARGIPVAAAAGNRGPDAPAQYPAAYPGVVAITAVDRYARVYPQANQGSYVDVAAPGEIGRAHV